MKIKSIRKCGRHPVYDISVRDVHHYVLSNGVVTHNTSVMYSANQIFIISKSQEKDGDDIVGWNFTINIEKSRFVREKSKLSFTVLNDIGIKKWSGIFSLGLASGLIVTATKGWYSLVDEDGVIDSKKFRAKELDTEEVCNKIVADKRFRDFVESKFKLTME